MASAAQTALERLSEIERPIRLAVEFSLVIILALLGAKLIWVIASPSDSVATYTERPLPTPMRGASSTLAISTDRTVLISVNPFDQGETELVVEDVPETSLNLQLDGLRMSTEGLGAGNAIIRTPDGRGSNFRVGDQILPGVTLERILSDRVIINRDGADETLMLGGRGVGLSVISDDSQVVTDNGIAETERDTGAESRETGVITGRLAGPDQLFGAINAGPVMTNGSLSGYRLNPIGNADTMRQAGLEPGDVLLQINGTSVVNLDMTDVIDRISAMQTAVLEVNRNGSQRTVRLSFGE
ncbi:MAG: PDZ domain-containing protein [Hyphomonas sp.]|nr:PDZ domain-containing protein [Hyphomonas sp.]